MVFNAAVQALKNADVDFIVVGGWSAVIHGSAHLTKDLDVFVSRTPENLRRIVSALAPHHPRPRDLPVGLPFIWDQATVGNSSVLTLITDLGAIDLLAEVRGLGSFEEVKAESVVVEAFGQTVRTLDLKSLIRSKRAAGRAKDLSILPELESLLEASQPE